METPHMVPSVFFRKQNFRALSLEPHVLAFVLRVLKLNPVLVGLRIVLDICVFKVLQQLSPNDTARTPLEALVAVSIQTKAIVNERFHIRRRNF